ncbi:hypothetical protein B9Z65_7707 [Elsinoe australis]|uniref:Chromate transport protein n=1 Tax=Elsinoe australis TaxID=40998 RepID=A0A2P8A0A4_9PEZI|nr:hypothetical protein B9Z65_7707 [Elsinoe australis]
MPSALGMLALGLGIEQVDDVLPAIAYAFLSGLNAAIVGIIALAAVQLSSRSVKSTLDRILIVFGGCAGVCYTSLWYFPVIIVSGGLITLSWNYVLAPVLIKVQRRRQSRRAAHEEPEKVVEDGDGRKPEIEHTQAVERSGGSIVNEDQALDTGAQRPAREHAQPMDPRADTVTYKVPIVTGIALVALFIGILVALLVTSRVMQNTPRPHEFVANMFLAGSIIFGGGPVLIPLMRDYVVQPGWVTPRDFLIGLAIIQVFPGPNFNFAVYLGVLSMMGTSYPVILGAFLGFMGIFVPGLAVAIGFMGFWSVLRSKPFVISLLRGVNCTAVGLIFTAVYRIWQIGYLTPEQQEGRPLGDEPWWLVVIVVSYAMSAWLKVPTAAAIVIGGVLGLCWYGAVGAP